MMFLNCRLGVAARLTALVALGAMGAACSSGASVTSGDSGGGGTPDVAVDVQVQPDTGAMDAPQAMDAPATTDTGAGSDSGAAGDAADTSVTPGHCASNMDCAGNPAGTACDTTTGMCVGCVGTPDSCPGSQHCDTVMHRCVAGCHDDTGCMDSHGETDGGAVHTSHCEPAMHLCVDCVTDAHCPSGMLCVGNVCTVGCSAAHSCPTGQTCCSGACVDPLSSTANCGMCDTRCTVSNGMAACMNGTCAVGTCSPGFADCNHMAADGCEANTNTSITNCGACGTACTTPANASPTCSMGTCGYTCNAGFADCNGSAADGCEVNLQNDPTHCGACTTLCNPPHGTATCTAGHCAVGTCESGYADCDMNPSNGCEADTRTNVSNCGTCGTACPSEPNAFPGCVGSTCVISCVAGFADCNGVTSDGCEVDTRTDSMNCGACARSCVVPHATAACTGSRCSIGTCDPGFADCDGNPANGCETNTNSDLGNCGMCGNACSVAGGTAVCTMGTCGIATCAAGRAHCASTGTACETNTTNDPANCGGCGNSCSLPHATAVCTASACAIGTCDPGYADCNHVAADGCEVDTRGDLGNCGGCGMVCAPAHAAAGMCIGGHCGIAACAPGYADCNSNPADGCEVNLGTDAANCGGCGQACPATTVCQGSVCTRYPSTGAEGAYAPTASGTLTPGIHNFTTITIPAGVTIRPSGSGVIDLRATGDVSIAGTIDVSGGAGANGGNCTCGNGGATGTGVAGAAGAAAANCAGGGGGMGAAGANGGGSSVGLGGNGGGGGGGYLGAGGGGGGFSGGVGGAADIGNPGGGGGGSETGGGGSALGGVAPPSGGSLAAACYGGGAGTAGVNRDNTGSAGGGGSIGAAATNDRAVTDATFRPGSGGGGGGGGAEEGGCGDGETGGGGGGGGGGAVRIATTTHLVIGGAVLANGGAGGVSPSATDDCSDDTGQSGGGGSGGVVYLYSPAITVTGRVTAVGGAGGDYTNNSCGVIGRSTGGAGGLGRLRISVDNVTAGACALGGMLNPPVAGTACASGSGACQAYVSRFPL